MDDEIERRRQERLQKYSNFVFIESDEEAFIKELSEINKSHEPLIKNTSIEYEQKYTENSLNRGIYTALMYFKRKI
ncbi:hypothetical protein CWI39_2840p0010 [Hamiltosporidium magnivora]|uniref:Uncharacterized protein n=1 Tax=Hamiltosporidium magnivora TaxID=148818 RepID=A0A4Q9KSI5_9MICR|nr:hypothetical protein CWI39_2840p0010 [Hamiltosporidium magnivora]